MLLSLCLFFTLPAVSQESSVPDFVLEETPDATEKQTERSTDVQVTLSNGIVLTGRLALDEIVNWSPESEASLRFLSADGQEIALQSNRVSSIEVVGATPTPAPESSTEAAPEAPQPVPVQEETPAAAASNNETPSQTAEGFSFSNPAASRYLYAPSSIGLQQGQGYVSQKLVFTTGVFAVSDNVTILFGAFGPFASVAGIKLSKQVSDKVHLGMGSEAFFLPLAGSFDPSSDAPNIPLSLFFGSVTYGTLEQHITFASGYIYDQILSDSNHTVPVMIAGHKRVNDRLAMVTENWVLLEPTLSSNNPFVLASINSIAFRLIGRRDQQTKVYGSMFTDTGYPRSTWDIGLVLVNFSQSHSIRNNVNGEDVSSTFRTHQMLGPIPWVDYTWHFGPARK